jgi:hypothetical protein
MKDDTTVSPIIQKAIAPKPEAVQPITAPITIQPPPLPLPTVTTDNQAFATRPEPIPNDPNPDTKSI